MTPPEPFPVDQYVRRVRRAADVSQRELARLADVSERTVARAEKNEVLPSLPVFRRLLSVAGYRLAVIDSTGHLVLPMIELPDGERDRQGRRFPAHLDVIIEPRCGEWWGDLMGIARPPETFRRSRWERDQQRERYVRDQRLYGRA